ncbi:MAG: MXAN_6640 family putative metalloprotease [bacterium]
MKNFSPAKPAAVIAALFFIALQGAAAAKFSDEDILFFYYSRNIPEKARADARFARRALPQRAADPRALNATLANLAVVRNWDRLSPATRNELARFISVAESRAGVREVSASVGYCSSFLSGISSSLSSEHFTVVYTTSAASQDRIAALTYSPSTYYGDGYVPAYVLDILQFAEEVWDHVIGGLGFDAPPLNNGKYVVYVCDILGRSGGTLLGRTVTDVLYPDNSARSFLELDNDYEVYYLYSNSVADLVKSTMAHEFTHAVQFGLNYLYPSYWILEATAVWMESEVYPTIHDWIKLYMTNRFNNLDLPLDYFSFSDTYGYGNAIYFKYISEKIGGSASMKAIWDLVKNDTQECLTSSPCEPADEATEIPQISTYLLSRGAVFNTVLKNFHVANYSKNYLDAASLPSVKLTGTFSSYPVSVSQESLDHLGAKFYKFTPSSTTQAKKLTLGFTGATTSSWGVTLLLKQTSGVFTTSDLTISNGVGSASIDGFGNTYDEVVLIVTNLTTSKSNTGTFSFTVSQSDSCSSSQSSGAFPAGWNMVVFPVIPLNSVPSQSVTVTSSGTLLNSGAIYYFSPTANTAYSGFSSYFQNLGRAGQGYWVNLASSSGLSLSGCIPEDTSLEVELPAGWNMFGNPFVTDVPWADNKVSVLRKNSSTVYTLSEAVANGWLAPVIFWYNGAGYTEILPNSGAELESWKAYWLKAATDVRLRIKK